MSNRNNVSDKLLEESKENFRKAKILLIKLMFWKKYVIIGTIDGEINITTPGILKRSSQLKYKTPLAKGTLKQLREEGWIK